LKKILKEYDNSIYIFIPEGPTGYLLIYFANSLSVVCNVEEAGGWVDLFKRLEDCFKKEELCYCG
jgi:hypothetical protein